MPQGLKYPFFASFVWQCLNIPAIVAVAIPSSPNSQCIQFARTQLSDVLHVKACVDFQPTAIGSYSGGEEYCFRKLAYAK